MQWTRFPSRRFIRSMRNHVAAPPQDPGSGILGARASRPQWAEGPGPKVRGRRPATWQSGRGKADVPPALVIPAVPAPSFPRKRESRCPENPGRFTGHVGQVVVDTRFMLEFAKSSRLTDGWRKSPGFSPAVLIFTIVNRRRRTISPYIHGVFLTPGVSAHQRHRASGATDIHAIADTWIPTTGRQPHPSILHCDGESRC